MSRLDDLTALLESSTAKISGHMTQINSLQAQVNSWAAEVTRLYNRWQAIADNVFNRNRRNDAENAYNTAVGRHRDYTNALNNERVKLGDEQLYREQIQDDLDAFNMAVNIGIGSGFGEDGSVEVAESQIALQEQAARNLETDADAEKKRRTLWMVIIIGGSLLVAGVIIYMVRKARKGK